MAHNMRFFRRSRLDIISFPGFRSNISNSIIARRFNPCPKTAAYGCRYRVQVWYRCRVDKTIFHCAHPSQKFQPPIIWSVCTGYRLNANFREGTVTRTYLREYFYATPNLLRASLPERVHMLMYSSGIIVNAHDGWWEDKGHRPMDFKILGRLKKLLQAKVTREDGKLFLLKHQKGWRNGGRKVLGA